jgi:diguanylate cyclase (GGDEF)-like protein/PAS domain S-box-containing protein
MTLFIIHTLILLWRFYIVVLYRRASSSIVTLQCVKKWTNLFTAAPFISGVSWGIILFFMSSFPPEYHFYVFGIILGLAAIGMSTLGAIFSIYIFFISPMIGLTILWMALQDGNLYNIAVMALIIGLSYYLFSVRRFSKNYQSAFIEKERSRLLKERMELALDESNTSILDWNIRSGELYISPGWKEFLGLSDSDLKNVISIWKRHIHRDDAKEFLKTLKMTIQNHSKIFENIHRVQYKDDHYIWVLTRARLFYNEEGAPTRMIGTHTDVTSEKELQLQYSLQAQMIEQTHDIVVSTDLDGYIKSWNKGSKLLLGYSSDEMIGSHISTIYLKEDFDNINETISSILLQKNEYHTEVRLLKKSNDILHANLSLSLLKDDNGVVVGVVGFAQDITQRVHAEKNLKEQKEILNHQAHHDALTNLPNRVLFNDRLEQTIKKAKREDNTFALLFLDLDHFKEINDSLGHDIGDKVLKIVTRRLNKIIRKEDTLARLGGDEFTIILSDLRYGQDASLLAQKILHELAKPIMLEKHHLYVSSSIGISLFPNDGSSASNLLKYADAAMYKAKDEGRNNFQFYSADMTELAFERVVMEASLRHAIANEEFIIYYQTQVDGRTGQLTGMEALLRWEHPTMGLVSPSKFIPLAEVTGLIIELDQLMMKTAMQQQVTWYEKGLNPGVLALNLTMKQLQQKGFIALLKKLLRETRCDPHWIELELSESHIMINVEETITILEQINTLGISLSIDDFGTGYSSLSYLKKLPINKIKIDQSFIRELPHDEEDASITKAIIALATSLNLKVIAEGVETKEQKEFLTQNGCHNIQGYYYSKPIIADEMEEILRK